MRQLWKLQPFFIFFQPCASAKHCLSQSYFLHSTVLSTVPILFRLISEQLRCDSAPLHHHPHTSIPPMPHSTAILSLCQMCIFFEKFFPLIYEICYIVILFLVLVYDIFVIRGKLPTRFCHRELWHSSCGSTYRKQDLVALV